jgi:formylglycine-generating enzyme required for sulfatase activity
VGKRLCGKKGGGALDVEDHADVEKSEWYAACSNAGTTKFPYGNSYDVSVCNGEDTKTAPTDVASLQGCNTKEGLFDMSGNVFEFEDACDGDGKTNECHGRGGSYFGSVDYLECKAVFPFYRNSREAYLGFRCCS